MAKRNQVTTELRISADAQLKNSRSFISQLEKIVDKFDFGDKINNQLVNAQSQLKNFNKALEKIQGKNVISDEELKNVVKAGKEIASLITKTEQLYSHLDNKELQKFSKEYINQIKAQEAAVAKIKNDYAAKTGKNFDKELANYDKLKAKIKELEKEQSNLSKNGISNLTTKKIEETNRKLEEQKAKLIEIRRIQEQSSNAYSSTLDIESKKRGYKNYDELKGVRNVSEDQIRKRLGITEYKEQSNLISTIGKEIKELEKNKQNSNALDKEAIKLAKKYQIENIKSLNDLKQQLKAKKDILETNKRDKSKLADEKAVTAEYRKQLQIIKDKNDIESAAKAAELKTIQKTSGGVYTSKASLSASASATNKSITNLTGQLTESGIETIANNAANTIAGKLDKLSNELAKANGDLSSIDETNKKLATQSERDKSNEGFNSIVKAVDEVDDNVNGYTTKDNDRIANDIIRLGVGNSAPYGDEIKQRIDQMVGDSGLKKKEAQEIYLQNDLFKQYNSQLEEEMNALKAGNGDIETLNTALRNLAETFDYLDDKMQQDFSNWFKEIDAMPENTKKQSIEKQEAFDLYQQERDKWNGYSRGVRNYVDNLNNVVNKKGPENNNLITHAKEADKLANNLSKAAEQSQYLGSTFDDIKNKVGYFLSMNYVFDQMTRKIREASDFTKNLDKDMVQIGLVLGQTANQTWKNFNTYANMADRLNTTVSDVTGAMKLFYQQGLSTVEVNKMVEASAIAAALGESSMAEASETLTSIINSYNLSASQAMDVTDKISMVAMVSAADFGELSIAIEKVASSAASAGLDLDHMMGYLGKMIETTREAPTNVGTALKTIVANFTQFKEDPTGLGEEGTEINKVDKALKSVNISLTNSTGEVRDLGEVLDELGKQWNTLTRSQKAYLATAIAGTRQQSRFYALMNDYDRTLELVGEASHSSGKATEQFALYQTSLTAATQRMNNEWEKFYNNILKNDTGLKILQNSAAGLLKVANKLGPVLTSIVGAGLLKGARGAFSYFSRIKEEIERINQNIISTEHLTNKTLAGKNILEGYSFSGLQNNNKASRGINSFGQNIANSRFSRLGGNEQVEQLKQLKIAQMALEDEDKKLIKNTQAIWKEFVTTSEETEILNGTITASTKAKISDAVATQTDTIAHTASTAVKWGEVAAQLALNLAVMAGVAVIGLAIAGIVSLINKRHENTLQAQEEAKAERENYTQLEELVNAYLEISERINQTTQEKEELEQATADLLEQYPELIAYIDSEGKAYAKTASEIKNYMKQKEADTLAAEKNAAIATLNDNTFKTNALWDDIFDGVHKENDDKMYGETQKTARDNLINAFNNMEAKGVNGGLYRTVTRSNGSQEGTSLQHLIKEEDYSAVQEWLNSAREAATKEIKRISGISDRSVNAEEKKRQIGVQEARLSSITAMEESIKDYQTAVKTDLADLAEKIYTKTIADAGLTDEKESLAQNVLKQKTKNALKEKNTNEIADYLQSNEYEALQNNIIEQLNELNNSEVIALEDLQETLATDTELSFSEAKAKIEDMKKRVPAATELLDEQLKDYEDLIKQLTNNGSIEKTNLESMNMSTLNLLADAKDNMRGDVSEGFNEVEFDKIYKQVLENPNFLKELNKLDTNNLGEVQKFKKKYASTLGEYGQNFLNELIKNPAYDAEKVAESLTGGQSIISGTGATKSEASLSDIASGASDEGAMNILSSDDEDRAQNLLLIGQKVKVSAEEISDSYREAYEDVVNSTEQIISQAEDKLDNHVNTIQQILGDKNWNIGDEIDYNSLSDGQKEIVKNSEKAITNLKKQIQFAEELQKRYESLTIAQKANIEYGNFRNGVIAANEMVNSLSNLASIYDVVTTKEYTQLDLINWIANDTSGQLLAALEVQNGQLLLNANSMEILAEAHKQEAIAAIDNEIAKTEAQIAYVEAHGATSQQVLDNLETIDTNEGNLSTNTATYMSSMMQNWTDWAKNVILNGTTIGRIINGLITAYNNLHKAEDEGTGTTNTITGGGTGATSTSDNSGGKTNEIDDLVTLETLQDKLAKLKALREGLNKMSGKDLLGGINEMGSYGSDGGSEDKFDPVIEKLEKFYNYMRQLEELEAKLNRLREKRNLIDASKNYYIDDLEKENSLLREQQAIYNNYIRDQGSYLAELQSQIQAQFSDWAYFNEDGVVQVKQTEFTANSEAEEERLNTFLELIDLYQNEYNTREENINKLYEIESTQLENIQTMYDKILSRVTDITDELNRQKDLLDHDMTMSFSNIAKFDIMDDQMGVAVGGISNAQAYLNDFEKQVSDLNKEVKNGPFSELLLWDETLNQWRTNEEALQDPSIIAKYEKMGYTWQDIDTYIRSVAVKSQSINEAIKETTDSVNEFAEVLKQLIDDRISTIQDFFGAATDELNKIFDTFNSKMEDIDNQNDLFGVSASALEEKYLTAVTAVAVLKQTLQSLRDNKGTILETIQKDYPEYIEMINGVAIVNKQAIEESTKLTEAQKSDLLQLYGILEASEDQITEMEDKLVDYFNTMMEMEREKRDAIIELKQSLHDELIARDQQEIDDLRSKYDKMSQLDNEYYSELSRRVSDARNLRDDRQQSANIGQMQAQLAVLKADNSGTYNDELINLQKQLNEALQTQADNEVTRELERIQREQQEREEDRQLTISAMENVLTFKDENSWYWQEAQRIWSEGPESVTGFLRASNEYANISDEQRAVEFENLTNSMNTAFTTLQTESGISDRISDGIVTEKSNEEQLKLDNVNSNLDFIQEQLGESGLAGKIDWSNSQTMSKLDSVIAGSNADALAITNKMQTLYTEKIGPGTEGVKNAITSYLGENSSIWKKLKETDDALDKTGLDMNSGFTDTVNAASNAATAITKCIETAKEEYINTDTRLYNWLNDKYAKDNAEKNGVDTGASTGATVKVPTTNGSGNSVSSTGGNGGGSNAASKPDLKIGSTISVKPGTRWYYDSYGTNPSGTARGGRITYTNLKGSHPYNIEGLGWIRKQDIVGYSKGGYVDYTGIANVHGTQTEPEAFLNAKQTRLFEGLRDSLVRSSSNRAYDKKESEIAKEEYNIDNISIEVKQIADIDAVDKITRRVKEEIYKDATSNKNNMAVRRR